MNKEKKNDFRRSARKKKPYRAPVLTVHGDIRGLTRTKKGNKADGTGKPRTRANGGNA